MYHIKEQRKKMTNQQQKKNGKLFVVSAPSGAGKTTLIDMVLKKNTGSSRLSDRVSRVITYTSKQPRSGDVHGVDYYFVSISEFEKKIEENFFLEWSNVYGAYYGTPREILAQLAMGVSYIVIVDRLGAQNIKRIYEEAILIWIVPPSIEILEERLRSRGTETAQKIEFRLALAREELQAEEFEKLFKYVLINADKSDACAELEAVLDENLK